MKAHHFYLGCAVLGVVIPNAAFWPWLLSHGIDPRRFLSDLFANGVSAFFGLDVIVSAVVLTGFVLIEARRLGLTRYWIPIVATCVVGVSLGLPLFLYQREVHLKRAGA